MIIEIGKEYVNKFSGWIAHVTKFSESGWGVGGLRNQYVHGYYYYPTNKKKTPFKMRWFTFLSSYEELNDVGD